MGMFRKGKTCIIAKFYRTDLVIYNHSRERKPQSYSGINTVKVFHVMGKALSGELSCAWIGLHGIFLLF